MPCDTRLRAGETVEQRRRDVREAVRRLDLALAAGTATVRIGPQGAITFAGWTRDRVTDACAYRALTVAGSAALRRALARAEAVSGRRVDARAVAGGVHSHDGGKTWGMG